MKTIRFSLGLRPKPRWGSLQRSPRPIAVFKGPTSKGRNGKRGGEEGGKEKGRREEKGKEGEEKEWKGRGVAP